MHTQADLLLVFRRNERSALCHHTPENRMHFDTVVTHSVSVASNDSVAATAAPTLSSAVHDCTTTFKVLQTAVPPLVCGLFDCALLFNLPFFQRCSNWTLCTQCKIESMAAFLLCRGLYRGHGKRLSQRQPLCAIRVTTQINRYVVRVPHAHCQNLFFLV